MPLYTHLQKTSRVIAKGYDTAKGALIVTDEQTKWVSRLKRVLRDIPRGLEIVVCQGAVAVHEAGWWKDNVYDTDLDLLMQGGVVRESAMQVFDIDSRRVRVNCESI